MRVYLPATLTSLAAAHVAGQLPAGTGFAVTPGVREHYLDDDAEELEYAASTLAARGSLRMLDADPRAVRRRVVVAADVVDAAVQPRDDLQVGAVRVADDIPWVAVAAIHVDAADAEPAVTVAARAILAADLDDDDACFLVDEAEAHELLWYAPEEIAELI